MVLLFTLHDWSRDCPDRSSRSLLATVVVAVFSLQDDGITVVGTVPAGLPTLAVPDLGLADLALLLVPAIGVSFVAYTDNVLTARSFALEGPVDRRQPGMDRARRSEHLRLAVPRVPGQLQRQPDRTRRCGRQPDPVVLPGRVADGAVDPGGGRSAAGGFPKAALGALVIFAAVRLIDVGEMRRFARFRRSELLLAVMTTIAVLGVGVLYGVLAAVALSVVDLLRRLAHPHDGILGLCAGNRRDARRR